MVFWEVFVVLLPVEKMEEIKEEGASGEDNAAAEVIFFVAVFFISLIFLHFKVVIITQPSPSHDVNVPALPIPAPVVRVNDRGSPARAKILLRWLPALTLRLPGLQAGRSQVQVPPRQEAALLAPGGRRGPEGRWQKGG